MRRECAQSDRTLLLTGWLREVCGKHDKFYLRGRAFIEKVRGVLSLALLSHLSFATFLPTLGFCGFLFLDDHF
jgi:hypothetical protein